MHDDSRRLDSPRDESLLRVLFVVHQRMERVTGVSAATLALGNALETRGHQVSYYGFNDAFGAQTRGGIPEMLRFPWHAARDLSRVAASYHMIDASTGDGWVWGSLGRPGGRHTALVTRSHGLEHVHAADLRRRARIGRLRLSMEYSLYHGGFRLWEVAQSLRVADAQVFLNHADRCHAIQRLGVRPSTAVVLPNGISEDALTSAPPAISTSDRPIELAFIGPWIPRKGAGAVVEMAQALSTRNVPFRLRLLGTGAPDAMVLGSFDDASRPRVSIVREFAPGTLPTLLEGAAVLLHPSWTEGFSLALVEGMAAGLAPVATRCGGATTVIQHERSGLLLANESGEFLARAVEKLAGDVELLARMRGEARQNVQAHRWDTIAERTVDVYRSAIARRTRATPAA
ncbi:MAG: glycosyltransferase family 4 protein [Gemmatimonadota bacterium]|nr:glycosyltransferase family 4 protein [Gemmatimonadota bacterium]